jgi:hypothetical protein
VKADILLSGLVSGITILLGVITADWLKRLRDRNEYTQRIVMDISQGFLIYVDYLAGHVLETVGISNESKLSQGEKDFWDNYIFLAKELRVLSETPRWPQRNARGIREAALALRVCAYANLHNCRIHKVPLHPDNATELERLEYELRDASRNKRDAKTVYRLASEKLDELKGQMLSRESATGS